jgi:hypothetical protein
MSYYNVLTNDLTGMVLESCLAAMAELLDDNNKTTTVEKLLDDYNLDLTSMGYNYQDKVEIFCNNEEIVITELNYDEIVSLKL